MPFNTNSHPWAQPGKHVLLFGRATSSDDLILTLGGSGSVVSWEWLHESVLFKYAEVEQHIVDHLRRLAALPRDEQPELEWVLEVLADPWASQHASDDLRRNARGLPDGLPSHGSPDASDLRAAMSPRHVQRLLAKLASPDTARVLFEVATLLVDVDDPAVDEALLRLLRATDSAAHQEGRPPRPHDVFGLDTYPHFAAFSAEPLLRTIALRRKDPRLDAICDSYDELAYLDKGKLDLVSRFLRLLDE